MIAFETLRKQLLNKTQKKILLVLTDISVLKLIEIYDLCVPQNGHLSNIRGSSIYLNINNKKIPGNIKKFLKIFRSV